MLFAFLKGTIEMQPLYDLLYLRIISCRTAPGGEYVLMGSVQYITYHFNIWHTLEKDPKDKEVNTLLKRVHLISGFHAINSRKPSYYSIFF